MTISQRTVAVTLTPAVLLLVPLIAMAFSDEVQWNLADFLIAGVLLCGAGYLISLALRASKRTVIRSVLIVAIIAVLLLVWAELAVGIFDSPIAGD